MRNIHEPAISPTLLFTEEEVSKVDWGKVFESEIILYVQKDINGIIRWKRGDRVRAEQSSYRPEWWTIWPVDKMGPTTVCVPGEYLGEKPPVDEKFDPKCDKCGKSASMFDDEGKWACFEHVMESRKEEITDTKMLDWLISKRMLRKFRFSRLETREDIISAMKEKP